MCSMYHYLLADLSQRIIFSLFSVAQLHLFNTRWLNICLFCRYFTVASLMLAWERANCKFSFIKTVECWYLWHSYFLCNTLILSLRSETCIHSTTDVCKWAGWHHPTVTSWLMSSGRHSVRNWQTTPSAW